MKKFLSRQDCFPIAKYYYKATTSVDVVVFPLNEKKNCISEIAFGICNDINCRRTENGKSEREREKNAFRWNKQRACLRPCESEKERERGFFIVLKGCHMFCFARA